MFKGVSEIKNKKNKQTKILCNLMPYSIDENEIFCIENTNIRLET